MKKDKIKVLDEVLSEERIKQFLTIDAPSGETPDFHRLQKAYRGMPPQYFEIFLDFYKEQGRDINVTSKHGETLLQSIQSHKQATPYIELLKAAGAN